MEDILPSMASNRKVQRLLNEFMDLLSEYEIADANLDQRNHNVLLAKTSSPLTNQIESGSLTTDKADTAPLKLDQKHPEHAGIESKDNAPVAKDQTNEVSADAPMTDPVNQDTQAKEGGF